MLENLEKSWKQILNLEFEKEYFQSLEKFVNDQYKNTNCFPPKDELFQAFKITPFDNIKVVILGQDPYHGKGQAHGLSFSVNDFIKIPPSLKNIYKELHSDLKIQKFNGNLTSWAEQGVLLLNTTLSVQESKAGSHQKKGWEIFTDQVIKQISDRKENCVFILWGNYAQKKINLINPSKHFIISSSHPSPFSAYQGFFGSKPFSKTNNFLKINNLETINW